MFDEWNKGELNSFLIDITALILKKQDDVQGKSGALIDKASKRERCSQRRQPAPPSTECCLPGRFWTRRA